MQILPRRLVSYKYESLRPLYIAELFLEEFSIEMKRGDKILLAKFSNVLNDILLPQDEETLKKILEKNFLTLAGHPIEYESTIHVIGELPEGRRGGTVDPLFWKNEIIPELLKRAAYPPSRPSASHCVIS